MINTKSSTFKTRKYQWKPRKLGATIRILLGLSAGFILWQKNGLADYFAYLATESLFPNLDAPAVQYAGVSFFVVLGFFACMSLAVVLVFFLARIVRFLFSKLFFSPAGSARVS
jgi:hypothetical protein